MEDKRIKNVSEYVEEICEVQKNYIHEYSLQYETPLFRGQPDVDFPILPSIARDRKNTADITIFNEERNLIEMAKFQMPTIFKKDLEPIELLALLQHHGIPTRLLDVTENSLVALYFACCDEKCMKKDGEVIAFKECQGRITNYPIIQAIADSYRICDDALVQAVDFVRIAKNFDYFKEHKDETELSAADSLILSAFKSPRFIYAPFSSLRQKLQQGRYILFHNSVKMTDKGNVDIEPIIREIPKDHDCIAARIQVAAEAKEEILRQLSFFGISRKTLFADNTDIVCEEIKKDAMARIGSTDDRYWSEKV
mgnify:CR=1 FL=1